MSNNNDLEQDFTEVAKEINEHLKQAAKCVEKARLLGQKHGVKYLANSGWRYSEEYTKEEQAKADQIEFKSLLKELSDAGWSTSSMRC